MKDYKPAATPGMYEEFMKTVIFLDFQHELETRIEDFRDLLEAPEKDLAATHENIRGAVTFARQVFNIFNDLKQNAIDDQEREEKDARRTE